MTVERKGIVKFRDQDQTIVGPDLKPGDLAPDFAAVTPAWKTVYPLQETARKVRILATVLSLETSVCDRETRRFNQEASALGPDVHTYVLSADLPFTQERWCGAAGIEAGVHPFRSCPGGFRRQVRLLAQRGPHLAPGDVCRRSG